MENGRNYGQPPKFLLFSAKMAIAPLRKSCEMTRFKKSSSQNVDSSLYKKLPQNLFFIKSLRVLYILATKGQSVMHEILSMMQLCMQTMTLCWSNHREVPRRNERWEERKRRGVLPFFDSFFSWFFSFSLPLSLCKNEPSSPKNIVVTAIKMRSIVPWWCNVGATSDVGMVQQKIPMEVLLVHRYSRLSLLLQKYCSSHLPTLFFPLCPDLLLPKNSSFLLTKRKAIGTSWSSKNPSVH